MKKVLSCLLCLCLVLSLCPRASANEAAPDLSGYISNRASRRYVEAMLSYHLWENKSVQKALKQGFSAVFLFEGCSDNMDDPELSDLSYYRVSAVCIVLRLDETGEPVIAYFNDNCSTLPDRPLEYGKWYIEGVGDVGPATICDGTYELYSVYHMGAYEALHIRTSMMDETLEAVYMTPEGYVTSRANEVNIHTRTGNHTIEKAMWSAGCMLVGDGDFSDFTELLESTYYTVHENFFTGLKVGTLTIDRQCLQEELLELYGDQEAVETLLTVSRCAHPDTYLKRCTEAASMEPKIFRAARETTLMTLPCSHADDARAIPVLTLQEGERVEVSGTIVNTGGDLWYRVELLDGTCYVRAEDMEEVPKTWWERILEFFGE